LPADLVTLRLCQRRTPGPLAGQRVEAEIAPRRPGARLQEMTGKPKTRQGANAKRLVGDDPSVRQRIVEACMTRLRARGHVDEVICHDLPLAFAEVMSAAGRSRRQVTFGALCDEVVRNFEAGERSGFYDAEADQWIDETTGSKLLDKPGRQEDYAQPTRGSIALAVPRRSRRRHDHDLVSRYMSAPDGFGLRRTPRSRPSTTPSGPTAFQLSRRHGAWGSANTPCAIGSFDCASTPRPGSQAGPRRTPRPAPGCGADDTALEPHGGSRRDGPP
jgi:hypothetical protein